MKYVTKIVLKSLSILTMIAQVVFGLAGIAVILAMGLMFFVQGEAKADMYKYVLQPENLTKFTLFISCLVALVIFACLIITMRSLHKVLNNIDKKDYFVEANLINIKIMTISMLTFTGANIISILMFANGHGKSVSSAFANSWSQIAIYAIFVAILYTIYLIFKYGVELQNDSNTVI